MIHTQHSRALPSSYISLSTPIFRHDYVQFVQAGENNEYGSRYVARSVEDCLGIDAMVSFPWLVAYQSDPRFRKYVQLIEKNLNSFDAVNEWADIISFLGRLLKVCRVV